MSRLQSGTDASPNPVASLARQIRGGGGAIARSQMSVGTTPRSSCLGSRRRPESPTGCPPRRSGNMPREAGRRVHIGGERTWARDTPTAQNAEGATTARPSPWARSARTLSDCTTLQGMLPNGSRIVGTRRTVARPTTDQPGRTATARFAFSGEARSRTGRSPCAPRRVFVTTRTFDTTQTVFGSRVTWIDGRRAAVERYVILSCGAQRTGEGSHEQPSQVRYCYSGLRGCDRRL